MKGNVKDKNKDLEEAKIKIVIAGSGCTSEAHVRNVSAADLFDIPFHLHNDFTCVWGQWSGDKFLAQEPSILAHEMNHWILMWVNWCVDVSTFILVLLRP